MAQAIFHIFILQTVVLFGQRKKGFRKENEFRNVHRHFARLRFENETLKAENIADIVIFFVREIILFADILTGDVNLDRTAFIRDVRERGLAHDTARHHTPRHRYGFAFVRLEIRFDRRAVRVYGVFHLLVRVLSFGLQFREFFSADFRLFDESFFRIRRVRFCGCGGLSVLLVFFHCSAPPSWNFSFAGLVLGERDLFHYKHVRFRVFGTYGDVVSHFRAD